jgi:hypothetical protein
MGVAPIEPVPPAWCRRPGVRSNQQGGIDWLGRIAAKAFESVERQLYANLVQNLPFRIVHNRGG